MRHLIFLSILFTLGCNESFKTATSSSTNPASTNTNLIGTNGAEQKKLQKVRLDFGSPYGSAEISTYQHFLTEGETITAIFGKSSPTNYDEQWGRLYLYVSETEDNPTEILSIAVKAPNKAVISGSCEDGICSVNFYSNFMQNKCKDAMQTWSYPTPGEYEVVATYKNETTRTIKISTIDPCGKFVSFMKKSDRVPASAKKIIKKKI